MQAQENPIRKVVNLMQDMQKEIAGELTKEKALFETFMCICTEYPAQLSESVESNKKTIKQLESQISSESAEQSKLEQDLKGHNEDKASAEKDLSKATMLREKEQTEAENSLTNSKATLAGVSQVLPVLEKGAGGASSALLQGPVASKLSALIAASSVITPTDKDAVVSFLNNEGQSSQDYAPQSGQIVGILKQMKDEMTHSIKEQQQGELVASDAFSDLKGAKDEEIAVAGESITTKEKRSGELSVTVARAKDSLEDTESELEDASTMLHTLATQCGVRKKAFEARLKLRNDEISAISEAVKVLNDDDALEVFKKAVPAAASALQTKSSGFLQTRHASTQFQQAVEIIRKASKQHSDLRLSFLLNSMSAKLRVVQRGGQAPDMSGVVKMIDGMIDLLEKEQADDETKKEWCYQESKKADKELDAKQDALEQLKAKGEEHNDDVANLAEELKDLEKSIAQVDKEVAQATELRKKEHAEYAEEVKLNEVAVQLIEKATNKLMKFYSPEAYKEEKTESEGASLLQTLSSHLKGKKVAPIPDLPDVPEYKQQNEGGVVALMGRIKNELLGDKQEAEINEKQAQKDYVELMGESATTRAQDAKSLVEKKSAKAELEAKIIENKEQTKTALDEVTNANQYVADIHASCDLLLQTFNDKKEARITELDGLKSAKAQLSSDR